MKQAKLPSYILLRRGIFYVRISVPKELRDLVGKAELKRSLNTSDRNKAALLAPPAIQVFQAEIEKARRQCTPVHTTITELPVEDARQFVRLRVERMQMLPDLSRSRGRQFLAGRGGADRARRLQENRDLLAFFEETEQDDFWDGWRTAFGRSTVQDYETEHGVRIDPQSIAHGLLSELGAQAQIEHLRRAIYRDENPHNSGSAPNHSPAFDSEGGGIGMDQLLSAHRAAKVPTWKPASSIAFVKVERLLKDWFGRDRVVAQITRDQWRGLIHILPRIPTGYTRLNAFKGLSVVQVVEAADAMPEPPLRLSVKTCGDYAIQINSLLNWAFKEGHVVQNHAKDLSPPIGAREVEPRRHFEVSELAQLFRSGDYAPGFAGRVRDGRFWLPLVALFTGMRSGEIARLNVSDIVEVRGVTCIRLSDAAGLKIKHSVRNVPLHSELRRLGFLEFVTAKRLAAEIPLFADIRAVDRRGKGTPLAG
ncbi:DUF6538 domain-containing protein [Brevundimonas sp. TWP2-3-4b1]|uniref:DUF6538 domain-containing protein n=1 Tax=Brevundimonas sp. TWP2-3-4b1 TaxID=2804580 RepID=UPI003CF2806A